MTPNPVTDGGPSPQQQAEPLAATVRSLDRKATIVLVTAAVALTLLHYVGRSPLALTPLLAVADDLGHHELALEGTARLVAWDEDLFARLVWWGVVCLAAYLVLPALVIRLVLRESLADYGLKRTGAFAGFPVYLAMLVVMLPLVALSAADERYQATYPFYRVSPGASLGPQFWCWELLYAAQFLGVEFFFRGFLVQGTRHRFGANAVTVMMVPYCMLHFGKPMPEAFAAIVAGMVLGVMSYRTRSVWLGAALHVAVAWSLDAAVLLRQS